MSFDNYNNVPAQYAPLTTDFTSTKYSAMMACEKTPHYHSFCQKASKKINTLFLGTALTITTAISAGSILNTPDYGSDRAFNGFMGAIVGALAGVTVASSLCTTIKEEGRKKDIADYYNGPRPGLK